MLKLVLQRPDVGCLHTSGSTVFIPLLSSRVNIVASSANSAVRRRRVGPLLVSHGPATSPGAPVQPAGGRWDEVPDAAGGPVPGRGKSGPGSAAGEAGVCTQSFCWSREILPIGI